MDFQHRAGGKTGVGGVASASESNRDRRERLRQLALETIDLNKVSIQHKLQYVFNMHLPLHLLPAVCSFKDLTRCICLVA